MEPQTCPQTLIWETGARWLWERLKAYRVPFLSTLIIGFLCYLFSFTNKLINHDETYCLFTKGATVTSGRWGLGLLDSVFPNVSMPWIYGVMALVLIAAGVCVIVRLFRIRRPLFQVLLAGCVISFPSLIATVSYMFTLAPYALSFLLAVTSLYLLKSRFRCRFLLAVGCMVGSLSIYQAYISIAAGLLVLLLIRRLLTGEDVPGVVKTGFSYLGFLIASLGSYYLATRLVNLVLHIDFNGYAGDSLSFRLSDIPGDILTAYGNFLSFFTTGYRGLINGSLCRWMHYFCLTAAGILLIFWGISRKKREIARFLLLAVLIGLLPLAINCMHLFSAEDAVHSLVLYGFIAVYVFVLMVADVCLDLPIPRIFQRLSRGAQHLGVLALAVILACNIYLANQVSLNLYLRYENAYAFYTGLVAQLQQTPGFDENTRIAVMGDYQSPKFYSDNFSFTSELTGTTGFLPSSYSKYRFLEYYLGITVPVSWDEELAFLREEEEFIQMPVYPNAGCCKMIGDYFVVKLSD